MDAPVKVIIRWSPSDLELDTVLSYSCEVPPSVQVPIRDTELSLSSIVVGLMRVGGRLRKRAHAYLIKDLTGVNVLNRERLGPCFSEI